MSHNEPAWRTSSWSSAGENCVEVAPTPDGVLLRHSRHPDDGTIAFSYDEWSRFVDDARSTERSTGGVASIVVGDSGAVVSSGTAGVVLRFDDGEWTAFVAGAEAEEFAFDAAPAG